MTLRILLADDHAILRDTIRKSFEAAGELVVGEAGTGEEAVELAVRLRPDVVVMDLSMPILDGIAATRRIRDFAPQCRVVVLTMHDDPTATHRALEAGAVGFLTKGSKFSDVLATVRAVAAGDTGLTPDIARTMLAAAQAERNEGPTADALLSDRQVEILQAIADGASTKQVARDLGITQKTVHNHLNAVYRRLDTQSLTHAVLSAVRLGIIDLN